MRACGRGILLLLAWVALVPVAISQVPTTTDRIEVPPPSAYTGDAACAKCHRKESEFYALTPHARDSSLATAKSIVGSFRPGKASCIPRIPTSS
jgi:hypothetical protein